MKLVSYAKNVNTTVDDYQRCDILFAHPTTEFSLRETTVWYYDAPRVSTGQTCHLSVNPGKVQTYVVVFLLLHNDLLTVIHC